MFNVKNKNIHDLFSLTLIENESSILVKEG